MITPQLLLDGYGYSHLTSHLARAGDVDKLYHLVTNSEWRRSSEQFDSSLRRYRNDVDIAFRSTENSLRSIIQASEREVLIEILSRLPTLSWISASLGQQATRQSPYLLEAIARAGNNTQALDRAANIPLPVRRAECMTWIGLSAFDRGDKDFARQIWKQAIRLLETVPSDFWNENLERIGELVCVLVRAGEKDRAAALNANFQEVVQRELEYAGGITSTARLARIKAWLSLGGTQAARSIINEIEDGQDRLSACLDALEFQISLPDRAYIALLDPAELVNEFLGEAAKRRQLAAILAGFGRIEQAWKIFRENPDEVTRSWILRSYIVFLLRAGDESKLSVFIDQAIETILAMQGPTVRLRHCANFLLGKQRDSLAYLFAGILPVMQRDFDNLPEPLDPQALEMVALAFSLLDDVKRTGTAIDRALSPDITVDDWDETNTQIAFARAFGETKDNIRFRQLFDYASLKGELWQKAELLVAIERYSFSLDDKDLWKKTVNLLEEICENDPFLANHPNTLGAIVVWKYRENPSGNIREIQSLIEKASMLLKNDGDRADGLAHLALTLAFNGLSDWIDYSLNEAFEVLHDESDPNTLGARDRNDV